MYVVHETMAKTAWLALNINLAAFVIACMDSAHTPPSFEAIKDTPVTATVLAVSTLSCRVRT